MHADPLLECSFFIPLRRDDELSDGEQHSQDLWDWLISDLFSRFGGTTIAPGLYRGVYEDPDTQQPVSDESHKLIVAVRESDLPSLRLLLSAACVLFQQKCIYLNVSGEVEFITAIDHETD